MALKNQKKIASSEVLEDLLFILGDAPFGLITGSERGIITMINRPAVEFLSLPANMDELIGMDLYLVLSGIPELQHEFHNLIKSPSKLHFILSLTPGGKHLSIRGNKIETGFIISIQNIKPIVNAEADTLSAVIKVQEEERKRLAREIHDGISPVMAAIKLNMEALISRNASRLDSQIIQALEAHISILNEISKDLRDISFALLPGVIRDFGLVHALGELCERINEQVDMRVTFQSNFENRLNPDYELSIYRIIQELIGNAIKHSGASQLTIQLLNHPKSLMVTVEDNGRGWDMDRSDQDISGTGLRNVKGRVKTLGGTQVINTEPGKGSCIMIEIPYNLYGNETNKDPGRG